MINYDPNGYNSGNLNDDMFFKNLISSVPFAGMQSMAAQMTPFNCAVYFECGGGLDQWFDIGNPAGGSGPNLGYNNPLNLSNVYYIGNLEMVFRCTAIEAGTSMSTYLTLGRKDTFQDWLFDLRPTIALTTTIDENLRRSFQSIGFNAIRMISSGGTLSAQRIDILFTGLKITF